LKCFRYGELQFAVNNLHNTRGVLEINGTDTVHVM